MSLHIEAKKGEIAELVLMPGDPLRAKFIAENFLENPVQYNKVRNMFGYTGTYKGKKVSVQGSGMGQPSFLIYANELIDFYGVKKIIRVGTAGSLRPEVKIKDVVIAQAACTDSNFLNQIFGTNTFAPIANFGLLKNAVAEAEKQNCTHHVGNIVSSDFFYHPIAEQWKQWAAYNVLAVEMETAALYTLAAQKNIESLGILTISDSLVTHEATTSEEREKTFKNMMSIALEAIIK